VQFLRRKNFCTKSVELTEEFSRFVNHDMFHLPRVANGGFYTLQRLHCNLPRAQNRTKTSRAEDIGTAPTPKVNLFNTPRGAEHVP